MLNLLSGKHFVSLSLGNELVYHCSNAQLTPDLATLIRHFPLRQTSIRELSFTLDMAPSLMGFAKFIPSLVCSLGIDDLFILF